MSTRQLPAQPSLKSLKAQAKQLLHGHRSGATEACRRIVAAHPRLGDFTPQTVREEPFALADAQLVVAREYGFDSWPKMQHALFAEEQHFRNEPGWEWVFAPSLDRPVGSSGGSCSGECGIALDYDNNRGLPRLEVHFAVDERHAQRQLRVVGFDEETKRYPFKEWGTGKSKTLAMYHCVLLFDEVPQGTVTHLGVEAKVEPEGTPSRN